MKNIYYLLLALWGWYEGVACVSVNEAVGADLMRNIYYLLLALWGWYEGVARVSVNEAKAGARAGASGISFQFDSYTIPILL